MAFLKALIAAVAIFGCVVLAAYLGQRQLMYQPNPTYTAPAAAGFPAAEEVVLPTSDGEKVIVWHVPPKGERPVVLYLHGNGNSLSMLVERFKRLVADGTGLVALAYRGSSGSTGSPTEDGLITDADTAYAFTAARYPIGRIAVWGESLGTGVAVALASTPKIDRLVLESPFTSAADVGSRGYWFCRCIF